MAEAWLSTMRKLSEFLSADQIEASARRTKFVQRTSKITGKLFLALVTFGRLDPFLDGEAYRFCSSSFLRLPRSLSVFSTCNFVVGLSVRR
jgi:hypothetical protein